ncbi:MAG: hypothetical protein H6656_11375 [Ardenticatenaceae bacterium]|nr:hypothetical protein [Ardenticatenaceae bacterium]
MRNNHGRSGKTFQPQLQRARSVSVQALSVRPAAATAARFEQLGQMHPVAPHRKAYHFFCGRPQRQT